MNWIMLVIAFILGAIVMFVTICIGYTAKQEEPVNRVHFYVARDNDGTLRLYMGKPIRGESIFSLCQEKCGKYMGCDSDLKMCGLNENDYEYVTWECEPLEVFINMED